MREFELVDVLRSRLAARRADTRLGIGDDAAILAPPAGHELVVTTDALVLGRHFPDDTSAYDIGYKSVAVNLSDIAAMGAVPTWLTIALAAPALAADWCDEFTAGLCAAAADRSVDIVGGDTTKSPTLVVSVTAIGQVPTGCALRRDAARVGDLVCVSGTLGDAAAGLACWPDRGHAGPDEAALIARLTRPTARVGAALRDHAHAAIDISDGLLADLGHVLAASDVGATLDVDALPCSPALARVVPDIGARRRLQSTGGDDYELCVTLDPRDLEAARAALDCPLTVIGCIEAGNGLRRVDGQGNVLDHDEVATGWDHFDGR